MSTTRKSRASQAADKAQAQADPQYTEGSAEITQEGLVIQLPQPITTDPQEALEQAQAETLAALEAGQVTLTPGPELVEALAAEAEGQLAEVKDYLGTVPVRNTWKAHGSPLKGWTYLGHGKEAEAKGFKVTKVELDPQGITFKGAAGKSASFGTATKFWAIVPTDATFKVEEPKATTTPRPVAEGRVSAATKLAAALSGDQAHAAAPEGYSIRWPKPAFDLLKADKGTEGPAWLVRCNAHGTTTPAKDTREGDSLGTKAQRPTWCKKCQADLAKAEAK